MLSKLSDQCRGRIARPGDYLVLVPAKCRLTSVNSFPVTFCNNRASYAKRQNLQPGEVGNRDYCFIPWVSLLSDPSLAAAPQGDW